MDMDNAKKKFVASLAIIVETLDGVDFAPNSTIYLAFGHDMELYERLTETLRRNGYVKMTAETIRLTKKGKELAANLKKTEAK